jgi:6-phosphogluconolactonase
MNTFIAVGPSASGAESPTSPATQFWMYVGTYTGQKSKGIQVCRFDAANGTVAGLELAAEAQNPTFLATYPRGQELASAERALLFAANEVGWGAKSGNVTAYRIDRATGKLTLLNQQPSRGAGPCHLSADASGRCVLVANYGSGSVAALPVMEDGRLREATAFIQHTGSSVNRQRQEGPHAHWIDTSPDNRFAFVCDLGLDKVMSYKLDPAAGSLAPNDPPSTGVKPGSGPRHLAFHPNGRFVYLISEMGNTVTAFAYGADHGTLKELQTLATLPEGATTPSSTAEVEVHPSGRFLYGSNRGHDSIAIFAIDPQSGRLTPAGHQPTRGKTPRNFAIDPTGRWLLAANQGTDNVVVFRIDPQTGSLTPNGTTLEVGAPVCLKFVPASSVSPAKPVP